MSTKQKLKIAVDMLMTAALLLLMPYALIGEMAHEWIGMGMLVLLILHHILNHSWIRNLGRGKYTGLRAVQTVLTALILISILGSMVSGILLSRYIFAFLNIRGLTALAGSMHMFCAYWGYILMSLHLGLHWGMVTGMAEKCFKSPSAARTLFARGLSLAIAIYGIRAFMARGIPGYLLMQVHFVFFNYEEPVTFFILDYMAVMGLFVFAGYYFGKVLRNRKRDKKRKKRKDEGMKAKKIISMMVAGVMVMGLLAGCSSNAGGSGRDTEETVQSETETQEATESTEEENVQSDTQEETEAQSLLQSEAGDTEAAADTASDTGNVLVVYYSATGNTEAVANVIAEAAGGDLFELVPSDPYTDEDLDWTNEESRVSTEYANEDQREVELAASGGSGRNRRLAGGHEVPLRCGRGGCAGLGGGTGTVIFENRILGNTGRVHVHSAHFLKRQK